MLGYLVLIIIIQAVESRSIRLLRFVVASVLMGTFFAWFFTPVDDIQMRLFNFYIAPSFLLPAISKETNIFLWQRLH